MKTILLWLAIFLVSPIAGQFTFVTKKIVQFDSSFSSDGIFKELVVPSAPIQPEYVTTTASCLLPDGSSLLAFHLGYIGSAGDGLMKITADGNLDATFGTNGVLRTSPFDQRQVKSIIRLASGKFLLATNDYSTKKHAYIYRLNSDFSIDATFGTSGYYRYSTDGTNEFLPQALLERSNGALIVGGVYNGNVYGFAAMFSLTSSGSLITTFGSSGLTTIFPEGNYFENTKILEQADSKIVLAYNFRRVSDGQTVVGINRTTTAGQTDATFNSGAPIIQNSKSGSGNDVFYNIFQRSDGTLLVAAKDTLSFLGCYNANGTVNTAFGTNGKIRYTNISNLLRSEKVNHYILVYKTDPLLVPRVARISEDGSLDVTYGNAGFMKIDAGIINASLTDTLFYQYYSHSNDANTLVVRRMSAVTSTRAFYNIPDLSFRSYLKLAYPISFDGGELLDIDAYEIKTALEMEVDYDGISNLDGLQFFAALTKLECSGNEITTLPELTSSLRYLDCSYNENLTTSDFTEYTELRFLNVKGTAISTLDISTLTKLTSLEVTSTDLSTLDVSNNLLLDSLLLMSTDISTLDISGLSKLTYLRGNSSPLTGLNLSGAIKLKNIGLTNCELTILDLSACSDLAYLDVYSNNLTSLILPNSSALYYMQAAWNWLTTISVPNTTASVYLNYNCLSSTSEPLGHTGIWDATPQRTNCATNVDNISELENSWKVFPNPAQHGLYVNAAPNTSWQLYNAQGQLMKSATLQHAEEYLDLHDCTPGIYTLKLGNRSAMIAVQ